MVKVHAQKTPTRKEILELMAMRYTPEQLRLHPLKANKKPSLSLMAKILCCTQYELKKMIDVIHIEDGIQNIKWGKGRPAKKLDLTNDQRDWIT
jgi:hypothetical protein